MTKQAGFTAEEWTLLRTTPPFVSGGVAAADPGGIFGAVKEATAGLRGMAESLRQGSDIELMAALMEDRSVPGLPDQKTMLGEGSREQQMANFKAAILGRIRESAELVGRKATPQEADAYKRMIMSVAEKTANAASEGGFLGFGGERVSSEEQSFLNEVKAALKI